jgi:type I restriction enzyme S subunit
MNNRSNDIPEGFKVTEIGLLPEEWKTARLENAANILMGQSPPSSTYNAESIGLPFFQGKADFGDVYPTTRKWCSAPVRIAEKDDVLLSVRAPIGDVNMATERCCIGRGLASIRANQNSAGQYLFYRLVFSKELLESKGTGTTFKEINKAAVTSFMLPLPPLPEQKAIACVLSTIQKAIETQDRIIASASELKKSLMRHLFTYGPVPLPEADKIPIKETEIGHLPEEWETAKLGDLFEIKQGKALSPQHRRGISPRLFLRTANVFWGRLDLANLDSMDFTDSEVSQLRLMPNDLLVCEGGDIGRTAIWRGELDVCCYQNHLHRLRPIRDVVYPLFYMYWMQAAHLLFGLYGGTGNKTTIPNLSQSRLKSFVLPLPPLPEQQEIASVLSAVDEKIETEQKRKASLQTLFKTMLHFLMTGKVRVKGLEVSAS